MAHTLAIFKHHISNPQIMLTRVQIEISTKLQALSDDDFLKVLNSQFKNWIATRKNLPGLALREDQLEDYSSFEFVYRQAHAATHASGLGPTEIDLGHIIKNVRSPYGMNKEMLEMFADEPAQVQRIMEIMIEVTHEHLLLEEMLRRMHLGIWDRMFKLDHSIHIDPTIKFWAPYH